jgi:hypothetical protein
VNLVRISRVKSKNATLKVEKDNKQFTKSPSKFLLVIVAIALVLSIPSFIPVIGASSLIPILVFTLLSLGFILFSRVGKKIALIILQVFTFILLGVSFIPFVGVFTLTIADILSLYSTKFHNSLRQRLGSGLLGEVRTGSV